MAIDFAALLEAASRPDNPVGQLLAQLLARAGAADEQPVHARGSGERMVLLEERCRLLAMRNRILAEAFGACRCWGSDARCMRCRGQGFPGWEAPRGDWLAELVVPLLERRPELFRSWFERSESAPATPTPTPPPTPH